MCEQPLVSIIVPIYNAQDHIARCVESIRRQTYKNLEIILLNDGSKDVSLQVCKMYAGVDKRIVLIDDSIVRGTTSGKIVGLLREAGASEIHMRISSPPFRNPCYYGTDIDSREHLIACQHTVPEIARIIGADSLGYLELEDLAQMIGSHNFCHACFSGEYPTEIPTHTEKDRFEGPLSKKKP